MDEVVAVLRGSGCAPRHGGGDGAVSRRVAQRGSETRTFGTDTAELVRVG